MARDTVTASAMELPPVVSAAEWQMAHDGQLVKEKAATHARDALAAERRRLPRILIDKASTPAAPGGDHLQHVSSQVNQE